MACQLSCQRALITWPRKRLAEEGGLGSAHLARSHGSAYPAPAQTAFPKVRERERRVKVHNQLRRLQPPLIGSEGGASVVAFCVSRHNERACTPRSEPAENSKFSCRTHGYRARRDRPETPRKPQIACVAGLVTSHAREVVVIVRGTSERDFDKADEPTNK